MKIQYLNLQDHGIYNNDERVITLEELTIDAMTITFKLFQNQEEEVEPTPTPTATTAPTPTPTPTSGTVTIPGGEVTVEMVIMGRMTMTTMIKLKIQPKILYLV